jgi:Alr-MurF fusion protein
VSTLISTITQIKLIKAGETIGYGRKGKANKDIIIAIIPIGYADGLNRKLSNGVGKFLINNKFAPIIGNICMDICMVDITGIDAQEGDDVIIFGDQYSIIDMAEQLETIPYEILTSVSARVKRVYFQE